MIDDLYVVKVEPHFDEAMRTYIITIKDRCGLVNLGISLPRLTPTLSFAEELWFGISWHECGDKSIRTVCVAYWAAQFDRV